jgi:hypothetical protein
VVTSLAEQGWISSALAENGILRRAPYRIWAGMLDVAILSCACTWGEQHHRSQILQIIYQECGRPVRIRDEDTLTVYRVIDPQTGELIDNGDRVEGQTIGADGDAPRLIVFCDELSPDRRVGQERRRSMYVGVDWAAPRSRRSWSPTRNAV